MAKYIAHASITENGKATGGSAGDQTGREVCIRVWYSKPWQYVLRITNEAVRKQFANNMIDLVNNNNVGYDQNGRNTLLTQAIKVNFDIAKIIVKCECDCSSAITVCILAAIYKVLGKEAYEKAYAVLVVSGNCATTSTLRSRLNKLSMINVHSSKDYTGSTSKAVYGDIYIKEGSHVVCYIDDGKKVGTSITLTIDGKWGTNTTKRLQEIFKTTVDGKVSNQHAIYKDENPGLRPSTFDWQDKPNGKGSRLIKAMQKWAGMSDCDGEIGPKTIKAFQKKLGTTQDGYVSNPSSMVKALQKWANKQ